MLILLVSFCLDKNHLYVKDDVLQGIPLFRRVSKDYACKLENLCFPVSRPEDRAIPSGRPSVYYSIHPDDVPYRLDTRQTKHHLSGRRAILSGPSLFREATVPALRPSGRLSMIDQL
jgi:hypothetical protein